MKTQFTKQIKKQTTTKDKLGVEPAEADAKPRRPRGWKPGSEMSHVTK